MPGRPASSSRAGVDHRPLQRRRAAVDDEDAHRGGLDRGDRDGVDDVVHGRAAREVVDRLVEPLQHRADGDRVRAALHGLVGVVARVEVGEDEDRRAARDRR